MRLSATVCWLRGGLCCCPAYDEAEPQDDLIDQLIRSVFLYLLACCCRSPAKSAGGGPCLGRLSQTALINSSCDHTKFLNKHKQMFAREQSASSSMLGALTLNECFFESVNPTQNIRRSHDYPNQPSLAVRRFSTRLLFRRIFVC
jgi:hypothetical protein